MGYGILEVIYILSGYKARVRQIRPGERFDDRLMHDMRMREEHRHAKMFPMFKPPPLPESSYDPPSRFEKAKTGKHLSQQQSDYLKSLNWTLNALVLN